MTDNQLLWKWRLIVLRILMALLFKMRYPEWGLHFGAENFQHGGSLERLNNEADALEASIMKQTGDMGRANE